MTSKIVGKMGDAFGGKPGVGSEIASHLLNTARLDLVMVGNAMNGIMSSWMSYCPTFISACERCPEIK